MNWKHLVSGELSVTVHVHFINGTEGPAIPCWSYVTEGLLRHRQREAILTVVRQSGEEPESYPSQPMEFFRLLLNLAEHGQTVEAGGFTGLAGGELLGFRGFAYMEPVWVPPGDSPPRNWLAMIGLTEDELTTLRDFGSTRVLSILGQAARFYPAPYWNERNRPSRVSLDSMRGSILARVSRFYAPGFSVFREGSRLVLRVFADRAEETVKALRALAPEAPLALLTRIHPYADGALVWLPGHTQATAITPPGSSGKHICGSFVLFIPEQQTEKEQVLEDGYALHLTTQSWRRVRSAILSQEDIETPRFVLHWIPAGFVESLPSPDGVALPTGRRLAKKIVLLQPDAESQAAITAAALVGFAKSVEDKVLAQFSLHSAKGELRVIVKFHPGGRASYELATRGEIDKTSLQRLLEELQMLVPPAVKKQIGFAVEFEIGH
jgi:Domain of unknown function (DUF3480)